MLYAVPRYSILNGNASVQYPSSLFPTVGVVELARLPAPSNVLVIVVTLADAAVDSVITVKDIAVAKDGLLTPDTLITVKNVTVYVSEAGKLTSGSLILISIVPPLVVDCSTAVNL